jgi:hypothetical protein
VVSPVLEPSVWQAREAAHEERVDRLTEDHRARRADQRPHPVEDFLFTYYPFRVGQLRRWHPGGDVGLAGAARMPRAAWPFHRTDAGVVRVDLGAFLARRGDTVRFVRRLVSSTATRPAQLGCFGLHEWAMVYRLSPDEVRHAGWPLRLGARGTDDVVESHRLRCTHFDAFRFYTEAAKPLNTRRPTLDGRIELEQPGCLHAGMDVYKWAMRLGPVVPGELVADSFALAREIRELDMRASPYDLTELGYEPVPIETPAGRAAYVAQQQSFAERAQSLRCRLVDVCDGVLEHSDAGAPT